MQNTLANCVVKHFFKVNEDPSMESLFKTSLDDIQFVIDGVKQIFNAEKLPVPIGFDDGDLNLDAPRIYSDLFSLRYIKYMSAIGTAIAAASLELSARSDVRSFITKILHLLSLRRTRSDVHLF
jgi:hypothetical protein